MNAMLKKLNNKKSGKKGFTLMEMLIVVAIIAILVAVAIPSFNAALGTAKQATDDANLRAAKAAATVQYLTNQVDSTVDAPKVDDYFNIESSTFSSTEPAAYGQSTPKGVIQITNISNDGVITVEWVSHS